MAVYVDDARNRLGRMVMCHMVADTEAELHEMAGRVGLRRQWFQPRSWPHYDVSVSRRRAVIAAGGRELSQRELVGVIRRLRGAA